MFKLFLFTQSFDEKEKQQVPGEFLKKWFEPLSKAVENVCQSMEVAVKIERQWKGLCGVKTIVQSIDQEIIFHAKDIAKIRSLLILAKP